MDRPLKVAVVGASGIGKHHAKWYATTGCEVAAFVGTSPQTCAKTSQALAQLFDFRGNAYQDVEVMLDREQPDIVDVCTPHPLHYEHGLKALEFGAHVMCEKPLVWEPGKPTEELLAMGQELVYQAQARGLKLGVSMQYVAAIRKYREVYESVRGTLKPESFFVEMESKRGTKESEDIWLDLASHPISMAMDLLPDGQVAYDTLGCEIGQKHTAARFQFVDASGTALSVEFELGDVGDRSPNRRFGANGFVADALGRPDENGVYRSVLSWPGGELVYQDTMHTTIEAFVDAVRQDNDALLATGETGLRNLEMQLGILDRANRV